MPNGLEQQLWEINGQLKQVLPVLEKMEERQTALGRELTAVSSDLKNLAEQFRDHKAQCGREIPQMTAVLDAVDKKTNDLAVEMATTQQEVGELQKRMEAREKRGWDIWTVVWSVTGSGIVTVLGALLVWKLTGKS